MSILTRLLIYDNNNQNKQNNVYHNAKVDAGWCVAQRRSQAVVGLDVDRCDGRLSICRVGAAQRDDDDEEDDAANHTASYRTDV